MANRNQYTRKVKKSMARVGSNGGRAVSSHFEIIGYNTRSRKRRISRENIYLGVCLPVEWRQEGKDREVERKLKGEGFLSIRKILKDINSTPNSMPCLLSNLRQFTHIFGPQLPSLFKGATESFRISLSSAFCDSKIMDVAICQPTKTSRAPKS